jgi:hypothetical protein
MPPGRLSVAEDKPRGSALGAGIKKISSRLVMVTVPIAAGSTIGFTKPVSPSETTSYLSTLVSMALGSLMSSSIFANANEVLAM